MPPAESASRAGATPKASGDRSSRTFGKQMISRLFSVWFTTAATAVCSFALFLTAYWFGNLKDQTLHGKPIATLSEYFYPPSYAIYSHSCLAFGRSSSLSASATTTINAWRFALWLLVLH